jgi:hypothetical protein
MKLATVILTAIVGLAAASLPPSLLKARRGEYKYTSSCKPESANKRRALRVPYMRSLLQPGRLAYA